MDYHIAVEDGQIPTQTEQTEADESEKCLASIQDKLSRLSPDNLNYATVCIYKVPEKYRNKNQEAYTPRLVSIGFVHCGENQLQAMEEYKLKYLQNFLHTFQVPLKDLVEYVNGQMKLVCCCYEDIYIRNLSERSGVKPSEVILFDGIFVIQLFLKNYFVEMKDNGDIIFDNPWVSKEILHDVLLFENQLPFKFLSNLYHEFCFDRVGKWLDGDNIRPPSFNQLVHKFFKDVGNTGKLSLKQDFGNARHLIEFLSILHMQGGGNKERPCGKELERRSNFALCPTATDLKAVGVKFQKGKGNVLLDIDFDTNSGVLTIPPLVVNDSTETLFLNVIAFEQSGYHQKHTTSFVVFLDNLIDTRRDVDILAESGIIRNELGSSEQVAQLFNNLYKEFITDPMDFYFVEHCRQLNDYSRDWWHRWIAAFTRWFAMLRHDYFSSPWSILSLVAAVIILGLTATQTAYSVIASG